MAKSIDRVRLVHPPADNIQNLRKLVCRNYILVERRRPVCPECGVGLVAASGCTHCPSCGWGKCG